MYFCAVNRALLHSEVQKFIRNYSEDTTVLAFKGSPFKDIGVQELIEQIQGFRKTRKKLPNWHRTEGIYFPPKLNIEQTSSELTAHYKSSLVAGTHLADITGGLGVDSFYFAKNFDTVTYFELNAALAGVASHNFEKLGARNIKCNVKDGLMAISKGRFDTIYVDPARRHSAKGKVFFLRDCEPNVVGKVDVILDHCDTLLIKTSPMLDISMGKSELEHVVEIHVVALENEVKELLWLLRKESSTIINIRTVNIVKNKIERFDFISGSEALPSYGLPEQYLYEPNAAIMKAGVFMSIPEAFGVLKLHANSHLYTSEELQEFPGRRFVIDRIIPYRKNEMKMHLAGTKANIATRNFPETVQLLRKKWKIKDGGSVYLFFTTLLNNEKMVLICSKINN
ncbi:MAG: class I SAM-dependent methyltransferase [Bacteroidota bacterium]